MSRPNPITQDPQLFVAQYLRNAPGYSEAEFDLYFSLQGNQQDKETRNAICRLFISGLIAHPEKMSDTLKNQVSIIELRLRMLQLMGVENSSQLMGFFSELIEKEKTGYVFATSGNSLIDATEHVLFQLKPGFMIVEISNKDRNMLDMKFTIIKDKKTYFLPTLTTSQLIRPQLYNSVAILVNNPNANSDNISAGLQLQSTGIGFSAQNNFQVTVVDSEVPEIERLMEVILNQFSENIVVPGPLSLVPYDQYCSLELFTKYLSYAFTSDESVTKEIEQIRRDIVRDSNLCSRQSCSVNLRNVVTELSNKGLSNNPKISEFVGTLGLGQQVPSANNVASPQDDTENNLPELRQRGGRKNDGNQ